MELPKIYLKEPDLTDLKSLIQYGYSANGYFVTTFEDKELTKVQYHSRARRSFEDLLAISRTYFPETTEVDLMKVLIEIKIKYYFCGSTRKIVFHYNGNHYLNKEHLNDFKEHSKELTYKDSTYTIDDLIEIYQKYENELQHNLS